MEFNMLEVLTAQVYYEHWEPFGNAFAAIRDRIKQQIEGHAANGAREVNILIISDLLHGPLQGLLVQSGLQLEAQRNPGTALMLQISNHGSLGTPQASIVRNLNDSSASGRWLTAFNPAAESPNDKDNYDLHHLYSLLADEGATSRLRWNIDRTAFSNNRQQILVESTAFGVTRRSIFWDSRSPMPLDLNGRYDLIVMRRGVCYCDDMSACCGVSCYDKTDVPFLKTISGALRQNDRSAAYLGGWNSKSAGKYWETALQQANIPHGRVVPAYREVVPLGGETAGVFMSHGRAMSANTLKVGVLGKRKGIW